MSKAERKLFTGKFIFISTLALLIILYFVADARNSTIFPPCFFHAITDLYCPGCGSQRALSSLLHGELMQAANFNLLFILCLPLVFYAGISSLVNVSKKEQLMQRIIYSTSFRKILFVVIIIFWITRNLSFYPFNLLAPHPLN